MAGARVPGRSKAVLREEAPDALRAILDRGAVEVPLAEDLASGNVLSRRLVFEATLRRLVEREPGVTVRSGAVVAGLEVSGDCGGVPRVAGVRTAGGERVLGDVVVDATGCASHAPSWLAAAGGRPPAETIQRCGFFYLTRHYRLRDGASFPTVRVPIVAPLPDTTVLAFPGDNRRFQLSVAVAAEDPLRHRMRDAAAFDRFLAAVPLSAPWLRSSSRGESHPPALTDPCVTVSRHTALTIQSDRSGASMPSAQTGRGHVG